MLTESQAREKWCPMVRELVTRGERGVAINRGNVNANASNSNCIASACMMWRYESQLQPVHSWQPHAPGGNVCQFRFSENEQCQHPKNSDIHNTRGYCGLAGEIAAAKK